MKNYLLILASVLGLGLLSGCSDSVTDALTGGEQCAPSIFCTKDNSTLDACCTTSSCRYVSATRTFSCNGTDCTSAAETAINFCSSKTSSKVESDLAKMLLLEKADNIVLKASIDEMYIDLGKEVQQ